MRDTKQNYENKIIKSCNACSGITVIRECEGTNICVF